MESQLQIVFLLALAGLASATSLKDELCERVAPSSHHDPNHGDEYLDFRSVNLTRQQECDSCTVECHIPQLGAFKAHLDAGLSCDKKLARCVLGECRASSYYPPRSVKSYFIHIKGARLEGAYNPSVVVSVVRGSSASFSTGTNVCRTPTVWHASNPEWDFSCRQLELEQSAVLKFSVYDMEIASANKIADVTKRLTDLVQEGTSVLRLNNAHGEIYGQSLTVEVISRPFEVPGSSNCEVADDQD